MNTTEPGGVTDALYIAALEVARKVAVRTDKERDAMTALDRALEAERARQSEPVAATGVAEPVAWRYRRATSDDEGHTDPALQRIRTSWIDVATSGMPIEDDFAIARACDREIEYAYTHQPEAARFRAVHLMDAGEFLDEYQRMQSEHPQSSSSRWALYALQSIHAHVPTETGEK